MKTELLIGALFFVGMAFAPAAMADHSDESDAEVDGLYLVVGDDGVEIWEESNDHDGLQTEDECLEFNEDNECIDLLLADDEFEL